MNNQKIGTYDRSELSGVTITAGNTVNAGSFSIPHAGIWLVRVQHRIQHNNSAAVIWMGLFTSSSGGSGRLTNDKNHWIHEHPTGEDGTGSATTAGHDAHGEWLVNAGTDQSYALTLYVHIAETQSRSFSTLYTTNDSNGVPNVDVVCIKGTTDTGISTITTV